MAMGIAAAAGICFWREYRIAAAVSNSQPVSNAIRPLPWAVCIGIILSFAPFAQAAEPPPDLARRVARRESQTLVERNEYAYRQSVRLQEMSERGAAQGEYREVRDVIFSPTKERTEKVVEEPRVTLKNLKMTEEDFRDIREIQPFVLVEEFLPIYETKFRGEEIMDGIDCWVLLVRPRQILQGQRLFDGLLWIQKRDYSIIRSEGQAVPQIVSMKQENLFPRFTTVRKPFHDNFWFPVYTYADDTLNFRSGAQRIKLTIRYSGYQKFGTESSIKFEN